MDKLLSQANNLEELEILLNKKLKQNSADNKEITVSNTLLQKILKDQYSTKQ